MTPPILVVSKNTISLYQEKENKKDGVDYGKDKT